MRHLINLVVLERLQLDELVGGVAENDHHCEKAEKAADKGTVIRHIIGQHEEKRPSVQVDEQRLLLHIIACAQPITHCFKISVKFISS